MEVWEVDAKIFKVLKLRARAEDLMMKWRRSILNQW
jgi:hypothetical protein